RPHVANLLKEVRWWGTFGDRVRTRSETDEEVGAIGSRGGRQRYELAKVVGARKRNSDAANAAVRRVEYGIAIVIEIGKAGERWRRRKGAMPWGPFLEAAVGRVIDTELGVEVNEWVRSGRSEQTLRNEQQHVAAAAAVTQSGIELDPVGITRCEIVDG